MTYSNIFGATLWQEWEGSGIEPTDSESILYYTTAHVDLDEQFVLRALAQALQRSGIVGSRYEGEQAISPESALQGFSGVLDGEDEPVRCDEDGETALGDEVDAPLPTTWVEVNPDASR